MITSAWIVWKTCCQGWVLWVTSQHNMRNMTFTVRYTSCTSCCVKSEALYLHNFGLITCTPGKNIVLCDM